MLQTQDNNIIGGILRFPPTSLELNCSGAPTPPLNPSARSSTITMRDYQSCFAPSINIINQRKSNFILSAINEDISDTLMDRRDFACESLLLSYVFCCMLYGFTVALTIGGGVCITSAWVPSKHDSLVLTITSFHSISNKISSYPHPRGDCAV